VKKNLCLCAGSLPWHKKKTQRKNVQKLAKRPQSSKEEEELHQSKHTDTGFRSAGADDDENIDLPQ
jgi:hypothetical protein